MSWFVAVPVAWTVVALLLGLLVGRGIRMESGAEPAFPVTGDPAATTPPSPRPTGPAPGAVPAVATAESRRTRPQDRRRGPAAWERVLSAAR